MMFKDVLNNKYVKIFLCFLVLIAIISIGLIVNLNYPNILHPDFSANIVLGRVIANENRIFFSKNWYYGHEIRFIHTQIIYSVLFRISSDFRIVTIWATIISLILFSICFLFFLKCIGYKEYSLFLLLLVLIPWPIGDISDYPYYIIILMQQDYIPYLCFAFITLGLFIYHLKLKKHLIPILITNTILTLLYSISGTRALISLIAPLLCLYLVILIKDLSKNGTKTFKSRKNEITLVISIGLSCLAGLIIFKFAIQKIFNIGSLIKFDFSLQSIFNAIGAFFRSISFPSTTSIAKMLFEIFIFFAIITTIIFYFISKKHNEITFEQRLVFDFTLIGVIITFISYCFINFYNDNNGFRYYFLTEIFLVIFTYIPIEAFIKKIKKTNHKKIIIPISSVTSTILILANYHFSYRIVRIFNDPDNNEKLANVVNEIVADKYSISYSCFEDSNLICQLSNGKIDSYTFSWQSFESGLLNSHNQLCEKKSFIKLNNISIVLNIKYINSNLFKKCITKSNYSKQIDTYKIFYVKDAHSFFENA